MAPKKEEEEEGEEELEDPDYPEEEVPDGFEMVEMNGRMVLRMK